MSFSFGIVGAEPNAISFVLDGCTETTFAARNSLQEAAVRTAVLIVLLRRGRSQIFDTVIGWIAVDVIDNSGLYAVNELENDSVNANALAVDARPPSSQTIRVSDELPRMPFIPIGLLIAPDSPSKFAS